MVSSELRGNKVTRITLLLRKTLIESRQSGNNRNSHKRHRDQGPNHTPALRGAAVSFREDAGIGGVDFAEDQVVADIPCAVEAGHDADE